jgi:hypothetical protein
MDALNEARQRLDGHKDIQIAANEIRQIVDEYKTRLGSIAANKLLRDFDNVVITILYPEDADEGIQSLLLEADRLEEDAGAEAVVDLLKGMAGKHKRLRERYIDALAQADMWPEVANIVTQVDIMQLSRSELEHGIFACSKIGIPERVNDMLQRHQDDYIDNAAKLFREEMRRQGIKPTRDTAS